MKFKYILTNVLIMQSVASCMEDATPAIAIAKLTTGLIKDITPFIKSEIIDRIRDSREKELFRESLKGGYTIYLDEQNNNRMQVAPVVVPYKINVIEAVFRAKDGREERENATYSAKALFNGALEKEELVRKRKFGRDEFADVDDPAKGVKKLVEILYECMDHNGKVVETGKKAKAPEMRNIKLSCKYVPSFFAGSFHKD